MTADLTHKDALFRTVAAEPVPNPVLPRFICDAVEGLLSPVYVPIDTIAASLGLSTASVLDALGALERSHGIGTFLDVSSRDNCSVRLRTPGRHAWLREMARHAPQTGR
jgi:hypothetical protein